MRTDALVVGVGMTTFGKHLDRSIKSLAAEAVIRRDRGRRDLRR